MIGHGFVLIISRQDSGLYLWPLAWNSGADSYLYYSNNGDCNGTVESIDLPLAFYFI